MKRIFPAIMVAMFLGSLIPAQAEDASLSDAQRFFKQYVDLEHNYDPAKAELYAANAVIRDTRVYQDGQSKTLTWTGENFKQIVKAQMPVARARSEQNTYSQINCLHEGPNVRIKCTRLSVQKKFAAPLELLLAPNGRGGWKIIEENCQSQP